MDLAIIDLHTRIGQGQRYNWTQVSEIEPDIYLGGIPQPKDDYVDERNENSVEAPHALIKKLGIGLVVSITDDKVYWNFEEGVHSLHFVLYDHPESNISIAFPRAIMVIEEARKQKKKVLIHCHAGISRSSTILAAYYLYKGLPSQPRYTRITTSLTRVEDVIRFIKSKRPFVLPNVGFIKLLCMYDEKIREIHDPPDDVLIEDDQCVVM